MNDIDVKEITDPVGYAKRWGFSKRTIQGWMAEGLPHLKIGSRRVRIVVADADRWVKEKYETRRMKG